MLDRITHYVLVHLILASVLSLNACVHKNYLFQSARLGTVIFSFAKKSQKFHVEIADTPSKRALGLMKRTHLRHDQGMLFIFDNEDRHSFWMKDTSLSLWLIFLDNEFKVVDFYIGIPHSIEAIVPKNPCKYVLEINQTSIDQSWIKLGSFVQFEPL